MASGLHESSGQDLDTFLDGSSGMASDQPSGAAAAAPPAHHQAALEEEKPEQPGEGECGGGEWEEWDQEEQERIVKKCCPEIAVLKDGGKIQAPWHRFVPNHKNLGPHWVCELCSGKNGSKRQVTEHHLGSKEHLNKIGQGDHPNRTHLVVYEKDYNIKIEKVVSHEMYGGPPSPEPEESEGGNALNLQAPGAATPAGQAAGLGAPGAAAAAHQQGPRAHSTSACQRPTRAAASTSDGLDEVVKELSEAMEQQAIAMRNMIDLVQMTGEEVQRVNARLDSLGFICCTASPVICTMSTTCVIAIACCSIASFSFLTTPLRSSDVEAAARGRR